MLPPAGEEVVEHRRGVGQASAGCRSPSPAGTPAARRLDRAVGIGASCAPEWSAGHRRQVGIVGLEGIAQTDPSRQVSSTAALPSESSRVIPAVRPAAPRARDPPPRNAYGSSPANSMTCAFRIGRVRDHDPLGCAEGPRVVQPKRALRAVDGDRCGSATRTPHRTEAVIPPGKSGRRRRPLVDPGRAERPAGARSGRLGDRPRRWPRRRSRGRRTPGSRRRQECRRPRARRRRAGPNANRRGTTNEASICTHLAHRPVGDQFEHLRRVCGWNRYMYASTSCLPGAPGRLHHHHHGGMVDPERFLAQHVLAGFQRLDRQLGVAWCARWRRRPRPPRRRPARRHTSRCGRRDRAPWSATNAAARPDRSCRPRPASRPGRTAAGRRTAGRSSLAR